MAKAALDKKRLMRELERDRKKTVAKRLAELRGLIRAARAVRREAIARIRFQCRTARAKLRTNCALRADKARAEGAAKIQHTQRELAEESNLEKLQSAADKRHRQGVVRAGLTSAKKARERAQESDDEVRGNIDRSMVEVFNKVRRHIKGSDRKSRTEAFLEWAEENPSEVYAIQGAEAEKEIRKMVREHNRSARRHDLAEVPF